VVSHALSPLAVKFLPPPRRALPSRRVPYRVAGPLTRLLPVQRAIHPGGTGGPPPVRLARGPASVRCKLGSYLVGGPLIRLLPVRRAIHPPGPWPAGENGQAAAGSARAACASTSIRRAVAGGSGGSP